MAAPPKRRTQTARMMDGALAQLGERLHGMQEVSGSIPLGSTSFSDEEMSEDIFSEERPSVSEGCRKVEAAFANTFRNSVRDGHMADGMTPDMV